MKWLGSSVLARVRLALPAFFTAKSPSAAVPKPNIACSAIAQKPVAKKREMRDEHWGGGTPVLRILCARRVSARDRSFLRI